MKLHSNCTGCKAIDGGSWECKLGYRVKGIRVFTPDEVCPKPLTDEDFSSLNSSVENEKGNR